MARQPTGPLGIAPQGPLRRRLSNGSTPHTVPNTVNTMLDHLHKALRDMETLRRRIDTGDATQADLDRVQSHLGSALQQSAILEAEL